MMDLLTRILLEVSNALLIPVILILLGLLVATLIQVGGISAEAASRRRRRPALLVEIGRLKSDSSLSFESERLGETYGLPTVILCNLRQTPEAVDKVLDDAQLLAERLLGRLALGIRLGPILGLSGTLIPLGPALVALSTGDVETLSSRLVVAFATTVIGLLVGGGCFALHAVRSRWYTQDLNDIDYLIRRKEDAHATTSATGR